MFGVRYPMFHVRYYFTSKNTEQGTPDIEFRSSEIPTERLSGLIRKNGH
jgi:hypothetical protein